jgi:hypothetical protein
MYISSYKHGDDRTVLLSDVCKMGKDKTSVVKPRSLEDRKSMQWKIGGLSSAWHCLFNSVYMRSSGS